MRLDISNFCSFGEEVSINILEGVTLITGDIDGTGGSNGAGKSALLEAFTYVNWGKARGTMEYPAGDHLIRDGCSDMYVKYINGEFDILRGRSLNSSSRLHITEDGKQQKFSTLAAGDKYLYGKTGIEYDTYIKTAYFQQGKDKAFSELTSSEARKKVVEMMGLDKWSKYQAKALTNIAEIKTKLNIATASLGEKSEDAYRQELIVSESVIMDLDGKIEKLKNDIQKAEDTLNAGIQALEQLKVDSKEARHMISQEGAKQKQKEAVISEIDKQSKLAWNLMKQVREGRVKHKELIDKIESLSFQVKLVDVALIQTELVNYKKDGSVLLEEQEQIKNSRNTIEAEIGFLNTRMEEYVIDTYGICPILKEKCDRISKEQLESQRQALSIEIDGKKASSNEMLSQINDISNVVKHLNEKIETCIEELEAYDRNIKIINEYNTSKNNIESNIELMNTNLGNINNLIMLANQQKDVLEKEIVEIENRKANIIKIVGKISDAEENVTKYKSEKESITNLLDKQTGMRFENLSKQNRIKENLEQMRTVSEQIGAMRNDLLMWETLSDAFGPNGVPAMIIEATKDEIEAIANNILQYGQQNVSINILLKEQKKSGDGFKDVFRIMIRDHNGNELPIFRLSGGEAYWVDLAVRSALFLSWRRRNKNPLVDILMIDEGIGKIDDLKRKVLIDVLKYLGTKIPYVLLITHTDIKSLKDEFDNVLVIKKKNGVSYV